MTDINPRHQSSQQSGSNALGGPAQEAAPSALKEPTARRDVSLAPPQDSVEIRGGDKLTRPVSAGGIKSSHKENGLAGAELKSPDKRASVLRPAEATEAQHSGRTLTDTKPAAPFDPEHDTHALPPALVTLGMTSPIGVLLLEHLQQAASKPEGRMFADYVAGLAQAGIPLNTLHAMAKRVLAPAQPHRMERLHRAMECVPLHASISVETAALLIGHLTMLCTTDPQRFDRLKSVYKSLDAHALSMAPYEFKPELFARAHPRDLQLLVNNLHALKIEAMPSQVRMDALTILATMDAEEATILTNRLLNPACNRTVDINKALIDLSMSYAQLAPSIKPQALLAAFAVLSMSEDSWKQLTTTLTAREPQNFVRLMQWVSTLGEEKGGKISQEDVHLVQMLSTIPSSDLKSLTYLWEDSEILLQYSSSETIVAAQAILSLPQSLREDFMSLQILMHGGREGALSLPLMTEFARLPAEKWGPVFHLLNDIETYVGHDSETGAVDFTRAFGLLSETEQLRCASISDTINYVNDVMGEQFTPEFIERRQGVVRTMRQVTLDAEAPSTASQPISNAALLEAAAASIVQAAMEIAPVEHDNENVMDTSRIAASRRSVEALRLRFVDDELPPLAESIAAIGAHITAEAAQTTNVYERAIYERKRGGDTEVANALRTLQGERRPNDFSASLATNPAEYFENDTHVGLGDMAALVWHAIGKWQSPGISGSAVAHEQAMMRFSLFMALAQSIEDDGHRVCSVGLLQRLLVPLQGRYDEAEVKSVALPAEMFTRAAEIWAQELNGADPTAEQFALFRARTLASAQALYGSGSNEVDVVARHIEGYQETLE